MVLVFRVTRQAPERWRRSSSWDSAIVSGRRERPVSAPTKWIIAERVAHPLCRVFCFPYAGGSANAYRGWARAISPHVDVFAVELPGRSTRFNETPIAVLDDLVDALLPIVAPHMDVPTLFFGHSNGALLSYALAVALQRQGL